MRRPLLAAIGVNLAWHAVLFAVALTLPSLGGAAPVVVNLAACVVPLGVIAWLGWWRAPWLTGVLPRRPWTLAPVVVVIGAELVRGIEGSSAVLVTSAVVMLSVGVSEELYARGVMQELLRTMRPLALVATVGLLFGAGHVLSGLVFGAPLTTSPSRCCTPRCSASSRRPCGCTSSPSGRWRCCTPGATG